MILLNLFVVNEVIMSGCALSIITEKLKYHVIISVNLKLCQHNVAGFLTLKSQMVCGLLGVLHLKKQLNFNCFATKEELQSV